MANKTVYPYGVGGETPTNIGVVNDLTTGGANKALSAEMGKVLNGKFNGQYGYVVAQSNKAIQLNLSVSSVNTYEITTPFLLRKGEILYVDTRGGLFSVITECDENGVLLRSLVYSPYRTGDISRIYQYTANADMYVVVNGRTGFTINIGGVENFLGETETGPFHCGIYLYPFRAIVGKRVILYKDSVCSGLKPTENYQVDCIKEDTTENYTWNALSFVPASAGTDTLNVRVRDSFDHQLNKSVIVTSSAMPQTKLANSEQIDVMWLGDSLIAFNGNLIGAEWYRMLATDDQETHIDTTTGAKQLPTYNICPGKIRLVGEQNWEARYVYAYTLDVLMTGKRTTAYNPNIGHSTSSTKNPWYNPDSTQPDEIGDDGFNKRVDLPWYFNNACGQGKYPKLFYIAIGINDMADISLTESITEKFVLLCKKIKTECDAIAGGESGIKIKVLNHQTYPLNNMYSYEFDVIRQRLYINALYDSYYKAIVDPENGISGFVELIDCASKFDWRVGYTQEKMASNTRFNGEQDIFIAECCHMNNVGAYNYADALIDDFLADSDYD